MDALDTPDTDTATTQPKRARAAKSSKRPLRSKRVRAADNATRDRVAQAYREELELDLPETPPDADIDEGETPPDATPAEVTPPAPPADPDAVLRDVKSVVRCVWLAWQWARKRKRPQLHVRFDKGERLADRLSSAIAPRAMGVAGVLVVAGIVGDAAGDLLEDVITDMVPTVEGVRQ